MDVSRLIVQQVSRITNGEDKNYKNFFLTVV